MRSSPSHVRAPAGQSAGERAHAKHRRYRGLEDAGQPLNGLTIDQILNGGMPVHLVGQREVVFQGSHLVHLPRQPRQCRACGTRTPGTSSSISTSIAGNAAVTFNPAKL